MLNKKNASTMNKSDFFNHKMQGKILVGNFKYLKCNTFFLHHDNCHKIHLHLIYLIKNIRICREMSRTFQKQRHLLCKMYIVKRAFSL